MQFSQLIQLYFERSTALQNYWTLYVVVIGGLLAVSNLRVRRDRLTVILVTILYACFAYKNMGAIAETTEQREAVLGLIHDYKGDDVQAGLINQRSSLEPKLISPSVESIRHFHIFCDVMTIGLLWAMERRRRLMATEATVQP